MPYDSATHFWWSAEMAVGSGQWAVGSGEASVVRENGRHAGSRLTTHDSRLTTSAHCPLQSKRPNASTQPPTSPSTCCSSLTSALKKRASPSADSIRPTVSRPPGELMSHTATRAPRRANARAEARPMPEPAPVTSATFPSNDPIAPPRLSRLPLPLGEGEGEGGLCLGGPLTRSFLAVPGGRA